MRIKLREDVVYGFTFSLPFITVFSVFVIYPIILELYLSFLHEPLVGPPQPGFKNFQAIFSDPIYIRSIINTILYVGIGVNIKMIFALLLSGLLTIKHRAVNILGSIYLLPWALPIVSGAVVFNWMLNADWGVINMILRFLGFKPVNWLGQWSTGMFSVILFHVWKFTPFWTLIFYAGRQGIPTELYEAARVDGADSKMTFRYVTLPLLKGLYLMCTLISTIWTLGDFVVVWLITRGGPADLTHVIPTLAYRYSFWQGYVNLGAATVVTILPATLLLIFIVLKWFKPVT